MRLPPALGLASKPRSPQVGRKGQTCAQYAFDAAASWWASCHVDHAAEPTDAQAVSAVMFTGALGAGFRRQLQSAGAPSQGEETKLIRLQTAAEACPVSCGTCPTCADSIHNGGEDGVDCGGPCPSACQHDAACVAFADSGLVPANMAAICTDGAGTAAGAVCHTIAKLGYTTASIGAVGAACSAQAADQTKGQECSAILATMMVPPAGRVPGEWRCVDGVWTGFTIAAIPIVSTHCGTILKENHYSAICHADGCQATCDVGYVQAGGDGVFTCHNGR